jgi:hypothetical protein
LPEFANKSGFPQNIIGFSTLSNQMIFGHFFALILTPKTAIPENMVTITVNKHEASISPCGEFTLCLSDSSPDSPAFLYVLRQRNLSAYQ